MQKLRTSIRSRPVVPCYFLWRVVSLLVVAGLLTVGFGGKRGWAQVEPSEKKRRQAMMQAIHAADVATAKSRFFLLNALAVVRSLPMKSVTDQGIMDLGFGEGFLWGIDGGSVEDRHFVDKISPQDAKVVQSFPAPNKSTIADGSKSIAFAQDRLWVLNYLDDLIYTLNPGDGRIVGSFAAPASDVTSGLGFDGTHLWYGQWDFFGTSGGALLRQISTNGTIIRSFRVPFDIIYDIEFVQGKMLVSGSEQSSGGYFIYEVDPATGRIVQQFDKAPCEYGLAFDGEFL